MRCTVAALLLLLTGGLAMAIEEPDYRVVERYPEFELRHYPPYLVAETEIDAGFDKAGNQAFRILAGYIFGDNRRSEKIEMTAPVSQRPDKAEGETIDMTAPVSQRPASAADADSGYVVSFVMPAQYTRETLPEPKDPRVRIRERPERLMAALRYSGRWTESNYRKHEKQLLDAVSAAGLTVVGEPVYARYNSPFSLWFLRRNEVMVEVERPEKSD
jgi:hypothetical protein